MGPPASVVRRRTVANNKDTQRADERFPLTKLTYCHVARLQRLHPPI
jgi:hypothetical protein